MYSQGGVRQSCTATELNSAGMLREEAQDCTGRQIGRILDDPAYVGRCVLTARPWRGTGSRSALTAATDP